MKLLLRWFLNTAALLITAYLCAGMQIDSIGAALVGAVVLAIINALIKPLFQILTLPITILTLGLFTLVINAVMLKLMSALVPGISTGGFFAVIWVALIYSVISTAISMVSKKD